MKSLLNEMELAGGMILQLMQDVNTMSLDKFQADVLATKAQIEKSDAILGGMVVGWTPYFLSTCYPRASRKLPIRPVLAMCQPSLGSGLFCTKFDGTKRTERAGQ